MLKGRLVLLAPRRTPFLTSAFSMPCTRMGRLISVASLSFVVCAFSFFASQTLSRPQCDPERFDSIRSIESLSHCSCAFNINVNINKDSLNNEILRRHFLEKTERFMIPFERYFSLLMPKASFVIPFSQLPFPSSVCFFVPSSSLSAASSQKD